MAATRLIALHVNKGRSVAACLEARTDYAKNPEKTEKGDLVTSYECDPVTVDEEFLLTKRKYQQITGRTQSSDVIAYQIRQSFKPGEITAEDANRIGYELALRFTKGRYAFIVATHTDRAHIHNHIIFNSTALDGTRKFKDFHLSGIALQRLSDMVCLEHNLSIIEKKPYRERQKRVSYPRRETIRERICHDIDQILRFSPPKDFDEFLQKLQEAGYEIKRGKNISIRGKGQDRFVRLSSLPEDYREAALREFFENPGSWKFPDRSRKTESKSRVSLLIDVQEKLQTKGPGYARWAKVHNLKEMSKSLLFLREHGFENLEQLDAFVAEKTAKRDELLASVRQSEKRITEIAALRKHIFNYSNTRATYEAYRKAGYSRKFFETHREEITIHKAAKKAFDELGVKRIPKVKALNAEYAAIMAEKKQAFAEYRQARDEVKEYLIVQENISSLYDAEQKEKDADRRRQQEQER
ncbi:MAG: relaxase/mobilization nuclease domain-containing protein [Oscillospiraceae bacterium]|nr:relaxase/mobilization nuclease domain-containing protein [Oscillospiraceae bacterium]